MTNVTRRNILKGGTVLAGGMAGILATGRAPAFAQGTTVHWIRWNDFVPASDQLLRKELLPEAEKALGIKVNLETVNGNDLQPRITSAIQSGSGPDIFMLFNNHPQIYAESLVDMADVTDGVGKQQGGYYDLCKSNSVDGQKWISAPWAVVGALIVYRKSWFDEIGVTSFPDTWEKYREAGKKLKAKGRPIGQTLGHTFGDAPTFSYPYMWSWGGTEIEKDGKTVNMNKKEVIESVKFMTAFWKEAHDEGGLAWDDTNNNRAFLSQTISATLNGASIYIEGLRNPEKYITEKGVPLKNDMQHAALPRGPAGQFAMHTYFSHAIPSYSKNQKAAKDLLKWVHTTAYEKWFVSQKGFATPPTATWESHKMWGEDPVMTPFKIAGKLGQAPGYPLSSGKKAAEVLTKYIITDMYAKAVQGASAEDAVKWAESEVKKIYIGGA
jgi:multiple sugar transport system substrate-binding protein